MYKSLYDFKSDTRGVLNFSSGLQFTVLEVTDQHWWLVHDSEGHVGYVPGNYLKECKHSTDEEALEFIEKSIATLKQRTKGKNSAIVKTHLEKLNEHRKKFATKINPPHSDSEEAIKDNLISENNNTPHRPAPKTPVDGENSLLTPQSVTPTVNSSVNSPAASLATSPGSVSSSGSPTTSSSSTTIASVTTAGHISEEIHCLEVHTTEVHATEVHATEVHAPEFSETDTIKLANSKCKKSTTKREAPQPPIIEQRPPVADSLGSITSSNSSLSSNSTTDTKNTSDSGIVNRSPTSRLNSSSTPPSRSGSTNALQNSSVRPKVRRAHSQNNETIKPLRLSTSPLQSKSHLASSITPPHSAGLTRTMSDSYRSQSPSRAAMQERIRSNSIQVPPSIGDEMVELVRRSTNLSHEKCSIAVNAVLTHLKYSVPALSSVMSQLLTTLDHPQHEAVEIVDTNLQVSKDATRLGIIFSEMAACKDDSQQRSWTLHEDEIIINEYLQELLSILNNADPQVVRQVLSSDDYEPIHTLVLYYQMETRIGLRLLLLQVFGSLCGVDSVIITELLTSVLPLEIARDIRADMQDIQKLSYSILVLVMIFSMGEQLPIQHYDHFNTDFMQFVLDTIESPPMACLDPDRLTDVLVNLVLSFNLHFNKYSDNIVMSVLAENGTAKTFTEKLIFLVNRGDDPVRLFEHEPAPPNSLVKFLIDLYSSRQTSGLLYTNDEMVLIDIMIRQLADLSAGDSARTAYLQLIQKFIMNTEYMLNSEPYRLYEISHCFQRIRNEEDINSHCDRVIIEELDEQYPRIFM